MSLDNVLFTSPPTTRHGEIVLLAVFIRLQLDCQTVGDCGRLSPTERTASDATRFSSSTGRAVHTAPTYPLCTTTTAASTCRLLHTSFAVADQSCVPTPSAPADAEPFPRRGLETFYKCAGVMTRCAAISARRLNRADVIRAVAAAD